MSGQITSETSVDRFAFQVTMLEKGADTLVTKINHLNEIQFKLKTALTTLWAVVVGWALSVDSFAIALIGYCVMAGFFYPDILILKSQDFYIRKLHEIHIYLNDTSRLDGDFSSRTIQAGLIFPLTSRNEQKVETHRSFLRYWYYDFIRRPYLLVPYTFLATCNLAVLIYLSR